MSNKTNILVVAGELSLPLRPSIRDLIFSFRYNPACNAYFYFTEQGPFPEYLKKVQFDLILFTDTWAGERWKGKQQVEKFVYKPLQYLKDLKVPKAIHPQDEWIYTDLLNEMIVHFGISHVFSCAPESEWKKIYDKLDYQNIKFHQVLTGYLEQRSVEKINSIAARSKKINKIGYRAFKAPPWLGSHGYLKTRVAEVFKEQAPKYGFSVDISTEDKDTISGDAWFGFMASCKYFIGVEGGSTIIDRNGDIWKKGTAFQKQHPGADFFEFEKNCFPQMDGNLQLIAISPRHLEACAAKTCQVLIEGQYNGILIPGRHYIEVKRDFSNLPEVFEKMKNEKLCQEIIDNAYRDIVDSGKYSYRGYTDLIISKTIEKKANQSGNNSFSQIHLLRNRLSERRFFRRKSA